MQENTHEIYVVVCYPSPGSKGGAAKLKVLSFVQELEISLVRIRVPCFSFKPYQAMRSGSFR